MPSNDPMPPAGWTPPTGLIPDDPDEVKVFTDENGTFGSTPVFGKVEGDTSDVYLWNYCKKVFDENLPTHEQKHNDCVSHAFGAAVEYLQCAMIANNRNPGLQFNFVSTEAIYGLARVQNGRLQFPPEGPDPRGGGGGTKPTAALQALSRYGLLPRGQYGNFDLRRYNEQLALAFGNRGLPPSLEARARDFPLKAGNQTAVSSFEEAAAAIRLGYPVTVGSHVGFGYERNPDGFCMRGASWGGHCMLFIGVRGRSGLCCLNSWGDNIFKGPTPDGMPKGAFWVDARDVRTMLSEGQSYAVSFFDGFPPVPWNF